MEYYVAVKTTLRYGFLAVYPLEDMRLLSKMCMKVMYGIPSSYGMGWQLY